MKYNHWSEKYIGTPFSKKKNCAWFVNFVLKNEFNNSVDFPFIDDTKRLIDESILINKLISDYGDEINSDDLQDGDGVLMRYTASQNWHLGIFFKDSSGKNKVLHNDSQFGSSIAHRFIDLSFAGIIVVGYYRFYKAKK